MGKIGSWYIGIAAEAFAAAQFARYGVNVSVQYGANQPEYDLIAAKGDILAENDAERKEVKEKIDFMETEQKGKKPDEIPQVDKDDLENLRKNLNEITEKRNAILEEYGNSNKNVKQLIDLALLANNMLKGEALDKFVKRSVELL